MNFRTTLFSVLFIIASGMLAQNNIVINPTPQWMQTGGASIQKPTRVRIIGNTSAHAPAVSLLKKLVEESAGKKDFPIYIGEKDDKEVRKFARHIPAKAEGYYLCIAPDKIVIAGHDKRGTYYGVRTLQQLLAGSELPVIEIKDYPDIAARGVVEGFYGTPWKFEDRISQLNFYGENKLNTYIYGPKDDPYHGFGEKWRVPYPEKEAASIKKLVAAANENQVDFVWAIHPGRDIKWTTEDRDLLMKKFESMYQLGVRAFAVFFDDISGEGTNADKQAELLNYVDDNFVKMKKDVIPLIMCPTEYNKSWSNIEKGYLPTLGKKLNPSVHIMWTGDRVISDIDVQGLEWINRHINRKAYIWWNFPVSDYVRDHLLMGPAYGLDTKAGKLMSGFMSNPMEFAEASKIAIYGVADYAWNVQQYRPEKAWENALKTMMPADYDAFRIFAHHNADLGPNGHGYRRDESWEFKETADAFLHGVKHRTLDARTNERVRKEFSDILFAANTLQHSTHNTALTNEMRPWLSQFRLLGESGLAATYLHEAFSEGNKSKFNELYRHITLLKKQMYENDHTLNQNPYQPGVKTGTLVLQPLIDSTLLILAGRYTQKYGEQLPSIIGYNPHLLHANVPQVKSVPVRYFRKTISITPMLEVVKVAPNGFFGIEMVPAQTILQAKINTGLSEFPAWASIQLSEDGQHWVPYAGKTTDRQEWLGNKTEKTYRFIRLLNTSDKEQECYLKAFEVKVE